MTGGGARVVAWAIVVAGLTAGAARWESPAGSHLDPFEFLSPGIMVSEGDRRRLERDEVVIRPLKGGDGHLGVFVLTRLNAPADTLAVWTHAVAELKRGKFVLAVGRLSDPPSVADLGDLELDDEDLQSMRTCVEANCDVKLSVPEMDALRAAAALGGTGWRDAVQAEFKRLLIARVEAYRRGGLRSLAPMADRREARPIHEWFAPILEMSPYLKRLPALDAWLTGYPAAGGEDIDSFFYWSKEYYGAGKPVISVTHVGMLQPPPGRGLPGVVTTAKQIYASHYVDGALGLTGMVEDSSRARRYLVYVNRSQVDVLRGRFSAITRAVLESRLKRNAPAIVRALRARLEGAPPEATVSLQTHSPLP